MKSLFRESLNPVAKVSSDRSASRNPLTAFLTASLATLFALLPACQRNSGQELIGPIFSRTSLGLLCWLICLGPVSAEQAQDAWVSVSLTPMFKSATSNSEQVSQLLMWDRVAVEKTHGDWTLVYAVDQYRTSRGYPGWVKSRDLTRRSPKSDSGFLTASEPRIHVRSAPSLEASVMNDAFLATRLPGVTGDLVTNESGDWYEVRVPGQTRSGWVLARQVARETPLQPGEASKVVAAAKKLSGVKYLWGGMSKAGIDCSGLVYTTYRLHGVTVPRDADQQFQIGSPVAKADLQPGDLVFFGPGGEVTHVGIFAGDKRFVHASSGGGVITSILFQGWYEQNYLGARRIVTKPSQKASVLVPRK